MPAPIIAAVDPNAFDRAPLDLAIAAAELTGARVIAAGAVPWRTEDDTRQLDELRRQLGIDTRLIEQLSPPRAMHELAGDLDAGLIVVGSTNRGLADRVLLGTTAEVMVNGAPCPVAIAPHGWTKRAIRTIAVGFVDTPEGRAALSTAHAFAARVGAHLRVVTVLHPAGGFDATRTQGVRTPRGAMLEGRHRTEVEAAVERAVAALPEGVEIETEFHVDDAADVLLRISAHVDLLLCGSRGYGPLRAVLLGGVSHRLVREASCPVLVLPRGVTAHVEDLETPADALATR
jgi:nucleotide-binding universal stress UspA family protein